MPKVQEVVDSRGATVRRRPVAGDLRWDGERWRRWSGRRWSRAAYSMRPEQLTDAKPFYRETRIDEARRIRALALAVEDQVARNAGTVIHEGPSGVVLAYRRPISHFFHAVLTVFTGGLWGLVWIAMILSRHEDRIRLEADRWGNIWARPIAGV
jgi:hypothetical protein